MDIAGYHSKKLCVSLCYWQTLPLMYDLTLAFLSSSFFYLLNYFFSGYPPNRKLSWWVMNQRAQYQLLKDGKKSWLSNERVQILDDVGFEWAPVSNKSKKKKKAKKKKKKNEKTKKEDDQGSSS